MWQQFSARILAFSKKKKKKVFMLAKTFCSPFLCCSPKKKQKKGHRSKRSANILVFYWLRAVNKGVAPRTAAAYGFRREIKMPAFGGRKNAGLCKNSVRKCWKKFRTFLLL